jgi:8-oxo-dGTP diphosphatase
MEAKVSMNPGVEERAAFCPLCAAPLELRPLFGMPRKACVRCDYVMFVSPSAAAAAVVTRGRDVLLIRRGIPPFRGCFGLPAGFQEYGESPAEAAIRETREETGLDIRIRRLLDAHYTLDDPRKRVNVVVYLAEIVAGVPVAADDASEVAFFPLDALPEPLAFESSRIVLARLRNEFPTGDIL